MASSIHRQTVSVIDTITKTVVLYPSQALVTREVSNIELKPGTNEVEIYGLTPTLDQHSIKVDGIGSASVTDMTVDLVPNKQSFAELYEDDLEIEMSDPENESDDDEKLDIVVRTLKVDLAALQDKFNSELANHNAIQQRQSFLTQWWSKIETENADAQKLQQFLDAYQIQSMKLAEEAMQSSKRTDELTKQRNRQTSRLKNATRGARLEEKKETVKKAREQAKQQMKKDADRKEKQRIKDERAKYWPKKVYKVTLHLDVPTETPGSSRRSSVSSVTLSKAPETESAAAANLEGSQQRFSLTLSYITFSASWAPRYDIDFSTASKTGKIIYRAEFKNETAELWDKTRLSLSTSQASFQGLDDEVPWLQPWRVGLSKASTAGALRSHQESSAPVQTHQKAQTPPQMNRNELFGIDGPWMNNTKQTAQQQQLAKLNQQQGSMHGHVARVLQRGERLDALQARPGFGHPQPMQVHAMQGTSLFSQPSPAQGIATTWTSAGASSLFGSRADNASAAPPAATRGHARAAAAAFASSHATGTAKLEEAEEEDQEVMANLYDDADTSAPRLDFEELTWEDHGLTTTYEIPGTRTLEPSSLTRRHKIASLPFNNLILTSIAVPKLRAAAFLRARFRNPSSSVTLLKGTAGLTLDGTFLGNTTLPRVSPCELITLPLGVDPAVHLSYAKPSVKRSTQGIFNKDQAHQFSRSIIITNTKSAPSELLVVDQVPVSEDERLRVELVEPRGLYREGDTATCGVSAQEDKKTGHKGKWGSATATVKKNGEVCFRVNLEKGGACRLPLEYEAKAPSSESITSK